MCVHGADVHGADVCVHGDDVHGADVCVHAADVHGADVGVRAADVHGAGVLVHRGCCVVPGSRRVLVPVGFWCVTCPHTTV